MNLKWKVATGDLEKMEHKIPHQVYLIEKIRPKDVQNPFYCICPFKHFSLRITFESASEIRRRGTSLNCPSGSCLYFWHRFCSQRHMMKVLTALQVMLQHSRAGHT
ncbi:hypothetical protein ILYODFUR_003889 [Ilyodon furcidens]|uniref:Uncharacterized protein n=1 Tax=Ilyodon furcidens TaxID=33524 RepID=A0ABV0SI85_9TELE